MRRIKLVVAYDGNDYHGWQFQPGKKTVEGELNKVLSELLNEDIEVIGASRTDAGVSALGNVAVFDTESRIPGDKFAYPLNERLPWDIRIQESEEVSTEFHPRKCESRKTYEYRILNTKFEIPTKSRYSTHIYYNLDENRMQEAAKYLIGEHDFTSFCSVNAQSLTRIRTIYDIKVFRENDEVVIRVTGNGFLYNMVRIIAGTLIDVGRGHLEPGEVENILNKKDRQYAGPTAPPNGLMLVKYNFMDL